MANNRELSQFANVVGYNDGNIGLGTDNPTAPLHISGANASSSLIKIEDNNNGFAASEIGVENGGRDLKVAAPQDIYFEDVDTGVRHLYIKSGGSVGIGTDDPGERLHLTTTSGNCKLRIDAASAASVDFYNSGTRFSDMFTDASTGNFTITNRQNADIILRTNGTNERLRINSSGQVSLGDEPSSGAGLLNVKPSSGDEYLKIRDAGDFNPSLNGVALDTRNSANTASKDLVVRSLNLVLWQNSSEKLRITSGGDVLLGGHSAYTYDDTGASNVILDIYGGATAGKRGILSLSGRVGDNNGDIGTIWFNNDNNSGSGPGNTMKLSAVIQAKITTSDGNSGNDAGAYMQFMTKPEGGSVLERLRITSGGKIQFTGTRGGTLQPNDDDTLELYTKATSGNASTGGGITFYNHHGGGHVMGGVIHVVKANGVYENSSSDMLFGTRVNGSDVAYRARITSVGDFQTYSSNVNIDISNTQSSGNNEAYIYARYGSTSMGAGTLSFRVYTNGNVQNTNNSYGSISDQNLKENIIDATSQWDDIKALQVRKYNFREATGHQTHTQLGLIAQEVETVSPGLVETTDVREGETVLDADGNQLESIKSINYSVLYMKAVKALQEAQTRIETLEAQNTDLLARVTALEGS